MTEQYTWREATAADDALLFDLFVAGAAADFAPLGLAEQQLRSLLAMQFRARQASYANQYAGALDMILCLEDGTPVGRHLLHRSRDTYRSVDLAVLPQFRNGGVGTWTLKQVQQFAAHEGVPLQLRVQRGNPAHALYQRLGFLPVTADEVAVEMEWTSREAATVSVNTLTLQKEIVVQDGSLPRTEVVEAIVHFLRDIGLRVEFGPVATSTFLPGMQMISNGLRVDEEMLLHPGDLLHEAGHLALMTPDRRSAELPVANDPAEEMAALAWSYAAAVHIGLPPEVVFHEHGYKGQGASLIREFATNRQPVGLPILWWLGMTTQATPETPSIFPRMLRWLREDQAPVHQDTSFADDADLNVRWLRLPQRFDVAALQAAVAAIPSDAWCAHFNQKDFEGNWSIVALRSRSGASSDIVPLGEAADFRDTPLLAASPALQSILSSFEFPLKSVRLMRLHAGSRVHEHRDRGLTLHDGEMRLHIPITTSDAVEFVVDGERLPLREGECWYIDFSLPHRIYNGGSIDRTHLVIDAVADAAALQWLQTLGNGSLQHTDVERREVVHAY